MSDYHFYEPSNGHGLPHDPIKAIVAPRPIGWISSMDRDGRINLAPYSYFNAFAGKPPIVGFSSEGWKDSVSNIEATGEFVYNLATMALADAMNASSASVPHEIDEMDLAGLMPAPSVLVKPPRVAIAAAAFECKLIRIIELTGIDGESADAYLTLGQVVGVHIDRDCLVDGLFDMTRAGTIARCGYRGDYIEATQLFQMFRPA